ncbi:hypothetical protein CA13_10380 [Planctomycetes bacterium CA13]|uniref:Uncharacterized protein n=1 Tax=Novipirellula herctigrandis TaxID=2527986 RepID=A0A5C5YX72_9BACT|nr:hypothetical protein CA13_10380 [Planctomycetes bacterium CA13]
MGWSLLDSDKPKSKSYIGDEPFDAIADCFSEVCRLYQRDWKRKPTLDELIGTVEAVLDAQLQDHTSDGATAELTELSFKTRKIPKRQAFAAGDVLQATMKGGDLVFARIFEVGDLGPMVGVYDSRGMSPINIAEIVTQPLIVKICPIHRETIEHREWLVIGKAKLKPADKKRPRGPLAICGNNNHLEMAEYYYGLRKPKYYDRDNWIVQKKG